MPDATLFSQSDELLDILGVAKSRLSGFEYNQANKPFALKDNLLSSNGTFDTCVKFVLCLCNLICDNIFINKKTSGSASYCSTASPFGGRLSWALEKLSNNSDPTFFASLFLFLDLTDIDLYT